MNDTTPQAPQPPLNTPEFSRLVAVESLKIGSTEQKLAAMAAECTELAKRFDLLTLDQLSAHLKITRKGQGETLRVIVSGHLVASLTQSCIITLEPVASRIEADFETVFDTADDSENNDSDIDSDNDEIREPIIDGMIDLGEMVAQNLAIEINPFPRADGADSSKLPLETAETRTNPFSVLEKLKNREN